MTAKKRNKVCKCPNKKSFCPVARSDKYKTQLNTNTSNDGIRDYAKKLTKLQMFWKTRQARTTVNIKHSPYDRRRLRANTRTSKHENTHEQDKSGCRCRTSPMIQTNQSKQAKQRKKDNQEHQRNSNTPTRTKTGDETMQNKYTGCD